MSLPYEYVPLIKASSFLVSTKGYLPLDPFSKAAIKHTIRINHFREDVSILLISKSSFKVFLNILVQCKPWSKLYLAIYENAAVVVMCIFIY